MKEVKSFLKIAALCAAIFVCGSASAEKQETYKDIIEKAQNLSLQQDRAQAVAILNSAAKREQKKQNNFKEILAAIDSISNLFYKDKAQQLYETALSLKQLDPQGAAAKLNEALKIEPNHLLINLELIRLFLVAGNCAGAQASIEKLTELYPYNEVLKIHKAQTDLCYGKLDVVEKELPQQKNTFWLTIQAELLFKRAAYVAVLETLSKSNSSKMPESYYWRWKAESELKQNSENSAQQYVQACKKLTNRQLRELWAEAFLCRRVSEVESFLKNNNNNKQ